MLNDNKKEIRNVLLGLLGVFLFMYYWNPISKMIANIFNAVIPLFIGLIIAYILNILMSFYEKHYFSKHTDAVFIKKTKRPMCLVAAIITFLGVIALVIGIVIPELISCIKLIISEVPPAIEKFIADEKIKDIVPQNILQTLYSINWNDFISKITSFVSGNIGTATETVFSAVSSITSSAAAFLIGVVFAVYVLLSKEKLKNQCSRLMNCHVPKKITDKITYVLSVLNNSFHRYIVGQTTEAVILGTLCMLGMLIFKFPYAAMIGTLIGFTAVIPIAGAYIGATIGAIMIFTVSPIKALLFIVFIIVLQQMENNLIYPKIVGKSIGLPPIFVLSAITIGGRTMGISGMLIAVPLTSALYRLIRENLKKQEAIKINKISK